MGYSSDLMPYVGDVPNKLGQVIIAGFSGHGMPQIYLAAKGISEMLRDGKTFEQTGLPKVLKPTTGRLLNKKNDILDTLASTPLRPSKI